MNQSLQRTEKLSPKRLALLACEFQELFSAAATNPPAGAADFLDHIEDLSDEDVDRLLAGKIGGAR